MPAHCRLGSLPPDAYSRIKANRTELVESRIRTGWEEKNRDFTETWYSLEARQRLRVAMQKF
jgi:hypothetical protein